MPMTTTHALVPFAVALAVADRPVPWRLTIVAAVASAAPDADGLFKHFLGVMPNGIWGHRGAAHSLFVALACGLLASAFHRWLRVRPLTAGLLIASAMASHGLLDMMTDVGQPVAYLWPVSSVRLFADWRPLHSSPVHLTHFPALVLQRFLIEMRQLIGPVFVAALAVRALRKLALRPSLSSAGPENRERDSGQAGERECVRAKARD
jgi:inner membrane protein